MKKYQGYIYTILSAIIFGLMPLCAKLIYNNGSNSITLVFHRFLFSTLFLYFLAKDKSKESLKIGKDKFRKIFFYP